VTTSLADLPDGARARLISVGGERAWRRRLLELGFVPGTELRVVRRVPVGNVLEVELRFSRMTLRIDEAAALQVQSPDADAATSAARSAGAGSPSAEPDA